MTGKKKPGTDTRQDMNGRNKSTQILVKKRSLAKLSKLYDREFEAFLSDMPAGTRPAEVFRLFDDLFSFKYLTTTKGQPTWKI